VNHIATELSVLFKGDEVMKMKMSGYGGVMGREAGVG
jgi:hypothetical protein